MDNDEITISPQRIQSAARRALIAAAPDYFSWPVEKQEQFRCLMSEDASRRAEQILLDQVLGIKCDLDSVEEVIDDLPIAQKNLLNWALLLIKGIGEDYIYLNEHLAEGDSLLNYETLFDFDHASHLFQMEANKKEFPDYEVHDYFALKFDLWIRLFIEDDFFYGSILSAADWICSEIEKVGDDLIDTLIPHEYVEGKNHGKQEKGGFVWDMKVDAGGLEKHLEELKHRWGKYRYNRWLPLSQEFAQLPPAVYIKDLEDEPDPYRLFIMMNENTLRQTRWRHFVSDITPMVADFSFIQTRLEQEINAANQFIHTQYQDILENFDPNVLPLRKKYKIVMSPEALDDLAHIDDDNDPKN